MKRIIISKEQLNRLDGLYFHLFIKRYKAEKEDIKELEKTIKFDFNKCDRLNIPFKVQNIVISMIDNYRDHYNKYFIDRLKEKNIIVEC